AERSLRFYQEVLGVKVVYRDATSIQVETPGSHDVIVFEEKRSGIGKMAGVTHFGFRLVDPNDIEAAEEAVRRAGGKIVDRGEFVPGEPYLFATDPDGYTIEIWYE
ncbi:MAG: VOC family protein, partial [Methanobacteriota archaeon]